MSLEHRDRSISESGRGYLEHYFFNLLWKPIYLLSQIYINVIFRNSKFTPCNRIFLFQNKSCRQAGSWIFFEIMWFFNRIFYFFYFHFFVKISYFFPRTLEFVMWIFGVVEWASLWWFERERRYYKYVTLEYYAI